MIKGKLKLIVPVLLILLVTIIGVTYAFYEYYRVGNNHQLIVGNIYLKYNENTNAINLTNVFPLTKEKARERTDNFITFTVSGLNTTTNKDIWYEIILNEGDEETGKVRAKTEDLVFDLSAIDENGNEMLLVDAMSYDSIDDKSIFVSVVNRNTTTEDQKTYKLRMWLSEDVIISDTLEGADYTTTDFANSYASAKISVYGDFVEKGTGIIGYVNYNVEGLGISEITPTPIYNNKSVTITNVITSDINPKFLGWSTEPNGEVMYLPGEEYIFDSGNVTLYPVLDLDLLSDVIKENLSLTTADSDGVQFVTGNENIANYVKYSGILWRIVSIDSDGNIKMMTQDNMINSNWNSTTTTTNTDYLTSGIPEYLNNTFLPTLDNYSKYLISTTWDCTTTTSSGSVKPTTTCSTSGYAGLITLYEHVKTKSSQASYLNNNTTWWTMTPYNSTSVWAGVSSTAQQGEVTVNINPNANVNPTNNFGIRPVVVLVSSILVNDVDGDGESGNGTADSPYEITL